jgi:hypothetical protein
MTTTLGTIARDENFLHLTVTPTPVMAPEDAFPQDRLYYRWDVVMTRHGAHPSIDSYTKLIDHIHLGYGGPTLSSMPLDPSAGVTVPDGAWAESIYIEAKDDILCPAFIEDGSCIHSEHTR